MRSSLNIEARQNIEVFVSKTRDDANHLTTELPCQHSCVHPDLCNLIIVQAQMEYVHKNLAGLIPQVTLSLHAPLSLSLSLFLSLQNVKILKILCPCLCSPARLSCDLSVR
jgi:hypothetical protein